MIYFKLHEYISLFDIDSDHPQQFNQLFFILYSSIHFWFKHKSTTHPRFQLTGIRINDLQIMTVILCHWDACPNNSAIRDLF